ncbi:hypothetical protein BCR35DRAFT_305361 [Leucosporidium creatinivorum]|uniref:Uncharacterized protein n=1 Tax=Leucosporidium creatinivorum TaxID=106004 RepID=A0A1Y2F2N2_9BASI|nr:hypothetical protein BCR35DRAFT_305361 [Leucosporidium creatinivorum]
MQNSDLDALLAQLRQSQDAPPAPAPAPAPPTQLQPAPSQAQLDALLSSLSPAAPTSRTRDVTTLSFPESIPILQSLALDSHFLASVVRLRERQDEEEVKLRDERAKIEQECKRKGLSAPAVSSKLRLWDREALARWKKLQGDQQVQLQELGVPTFYRTRNESALKKQERVMSVLLGFLDDEQD